MKQQKMTKTERFIAWIERQGWFIWFEKHILDFDFYVLKCGLCDAVLQKRRTYYLNSNLTSVTLICNNQKCRRKDKEIVLKGEK